MIHQGSEAETPGTEVGRLWMELFCPNVDKQEAGRP